MTNKMRSAIGGLAMLASAAIGESVTNAPVITGIKKVSYAPLDAITISATNFTENLVFNLYKSTNLVDWVKTPLAYSDSVSTNNSSKVYYESDSNFRNKSFFILSTTNVSSFKK